MCVCGVETLLIETQISASALYLVALGETGSRLSCFCCTLTSIQILCVVLMQQNISNPNSVELFCHIPDCFTSVFLDQWDSAVLFTHLVYKDPFLLLQFTMFRFTHSLVVGVLDGGCVWGGEVWEDLPASTVLILTCWRISPTFHCLDEKMISSFFSLRPVQMHCLGKGPSYCNKTLLKDVMVLCLRLLLITEVWPVQKRWFKRPKVQKSSELRCPLTFGCIVYICTGCSACVFQ